MLIADRTGTVIPYALDDLQDRGTFFAPLGDPVYECMFASANNRGNDLPP